MTSPAGNFMTISSYRALFLALALAGLGLGHAQAPQPAKPDPARGQQLVGQVCGACHGLDGNAVIPVNPRLAGQGAEYLVKELGDYAKPAGDQSGRENAVMAAFASTLSPDDRRNVAAYLSAQKQIPAAARSKDAIDLGQRIYRTGIPEKAVPACAGCHGPTGAGLPVLYPRIGGQNPDYIEAQLKAFRDGTRRNNAAMTTIAARLSESEMKALADYAAALRAAL
jgi:hypothetical protein